MRQAQVDPDAVPSPCYVVDLAALEDNLRLLHEVQARAGCKILLALKGFAMWSTFPLVARYLAGAAASSPHEARLAREHMGKEVHVYAPAFSEASLRASLPHATHVVFNSLGQWAHLGPLARAAGRSVGLRVNPEHSEVTVPLYDPCAPRSRLGVTRAALDAANPSDLDGVEGLHFHTLCELGADALVRTLAAVEARFADLLARVRWVNFGGGHHITRPGYDVDALVQAIRSFRARWDVEVILEPGEAVALHTGVLVATVLDVLDTGEGPVAILDTSASAHMPDVLEMPYRPEVRGAGEPGSTPHTVRLGGATCLAGDVIGDYAFPAPVRPGQRLVFEDMAHYTMVKNTTFNGVALPAIATFDPRTGATTVHRAFGYEDYAGRLS